ncbi:hypothetical protein MLD38_029168 [Melastoma candidum]|uniref:Uncharacterized protein n=1 Tax=Melastoma candidum TaxID=119954 RepID=A0ACB9N538_9MYRT|nr:hypothetical protein MLD38_029168 [Melastoma candidum]
MDCNKDEATKAIEIAKGKFRERDFAGAKHFALKAQKLYSRLDGLPQMMATIDVYIHSEKYSFVGRWTEGAFKLVSDAWKLLSVPSQRQAYNQKRNGGILQTEMQASSRDLAGQSPGNGFHVHESKRLNAKARIKKDTSLENNAADSVAYGTFWTICSNCRTHYEYQRCYMNHNLLCPNCRRVFVASEKPPPQHVFISKRSHSFQGAAASASSTTQGASGLNQINREENHASRDIWNFASQEEAPTKRTKVGNHTIHGTGGCESVSGLGRSVLSSVDIGLAFPPINLLMRKARVGINKKLKEWTSEAKLKIDEDPVKGTRAFTMDGKSNVKPRGSGASEAGNASLSINVPDSDFHNFDLDRSEGSFDVDQVWAAYDDADGMPRFYARIHKVISLVPFKIKLSWLDPENDNQFGYSVCGEFVAGKPESCNKLNGFSHKVVWSESEVGYGTIRIFPRKGDTWALYRNWSLEWTEDTPDDAVQRYEIVEVLDDYTEERGILVSPLMKVAGFRSVFRPCEDPRKVMLISKEEMTRFSHQVPCHMLTGEEAPNLCRGFRELDPAALPEELHQEDKDKKADTGTRSR